MLAGRTALQRAKKRAEVHTAISVLAFAPVAAAVVKSIEYVPGSPCGLLAHVHGHWSLVTARHAVAQEQGNILPKDLQERSGRKYEISRIAVRTVWFDRELLAALNADRQPQPLLARVASDGGGGVKLDLHPNATPRQVPHLSVQGRNTWCYCRNTVSFWRSIINLKACGSAKSVCWPLEVLLPLSVFWKNSVKANQLLIRWSFWELAWTHEHGD